MNVPKSKTPPDKLGHIGFNAGKERKRAARILAAKLEFEDVTALLKHLLDERIKAILPDEFRSVVQAGETDDPPKKARGKGDRAA